MSPSPGASPAPTPSTTSPAGGQPSPAASLQQVVKLRVENVDYAALQADPKLKAAFEGAIKKEVSIEAGVAATDVVLNLAPGSVNVVASVEPFKGAPVKDTKGLAEAVAMAVSGLAGIQYASTGAISVSVAEVASASPIPSALAAATPGDVVSETCKPMCVEGHGVCEQGTCFCRTPFTGLQCEKRMKGELVRVGYPTATVVALIAVGLGVLIGVLLFRTMLQARKDVVIEEDRPGREVWRPGG